MPSNWQALTVDQIKAQHEGSVAIGPFGSRMKADRYVSGGVPVIRGNNLADTRSFIDEFVYVSEETADELRSSNAVADDLVFPHRGAIGRVGIVPRDGKARYMLSTSLMKLSCNTELVDPLFVYYFFRSTQGRQALLERASTVGTPGIGQPLTSLRSIDISLPPLGEQHAIASILGNLDHKIDLNKQMAKALESLASAHVDIAGKSGVPRPIRDLASLQRTTVNPSDTPETVYDHFSLPAFDSGRVPVREQGNAIRSNKFLVPEGSVLVSKLNPQIPRVWRPDDAAMVNPVASTEWVILQTPDAVTADVLHALVVGPAFRDNLTSFVTGTTGSHQRVRPDDVLQMEVRWPRDPLTLAAAVGPIYELSRSRMRETRTLVQLRDALLPKLISGELRVNQVRQLAPAAT